MLARRLMLVCAAMLVAAPLTAQEGEHRWSDDRPDALAPPRAGGGGVVPAGAFRIQYAFTNTRFSGLRLGTEEVTPSEVLGYYAATPFERRDRIHRGVLSIGVSRGLTLRVDAHWADRTRDITDEEFFITTSASGVGDVGVEALFSVHEGSATRVLLSAGAQLPVGSIEERGDLLALRDQLLPFEMQPGAGSVAVVPGVQAETQNASGTVGAQVRAHLRVADNDRGYRLGDQVTAHGWIGYRLNDHVAVTSGVIAESWGSIRGVPTDVTIGRDPGEDPVFSGGSRVEVPLGLNILIPTGAFAGHRVSMEFGWPVHQRYDNYHLATDWSFTLGWAKTF